LIKIVVTGMGKERIAQLARDTGAGEVEATVKTDFEAALAVQSGTADYYIGACQSGAGGALGVATALLGSGQVLRLSGTGAADATAQIDAAVRDGVKAFGLAHTHVDTMVPALVRAIVQARAGQRG
jgi:hypothetical protein